MQKNTPYDSSQFWTVKNLAKLLGSKNSDNKKVSTADKILEDTSSIIGVSIDTRTIKKGEAFIAIEGENFDGHDFIEQAFEKSAELVITSKPVISKSGKVLQLDSSIKNGANALTLLAQNWRKYLNNANTLIIAVVGSNGKTTTRRLIHQTLNGAYSNNLKKTLKGTQSPASFNNNLGVAITLLNTSVLDDFVVTEIGTNHVGEIATLGKLAKPDIAVITSIGQEHLEYFGDISAVAKEEASILKIIDNKKYSNLYSNISPIALVEKDALFLLKKYELLPEHIDIKSYSALKFQSTAQGEKITLTNGNHFTLALFGKHNVANARAAIEMGRFLGITDKTISDNLANALPAPGRFEPIEKDGITFINDSYNANPDSMLQSLNTFSRLKAKGRKIIILGDMLELGDKSPSLHEQIGEHILHLSQSAKVIDKLILVGDLAKHIATAILKTQEKIDISYCQPNSIISKINGAFLKDDLVLLKASRAIKLERIIDKCTSGILD